MRHRIPARKSGIDTHFPLCNHGYHYKEETFNLYLTLIILPDRNRGSRLLSHLQQLTLSCCCFFFFRLSNLVLETIVRLANIDAGFYNQQALGLINCLIRTDRSENIKTRTPLTFLFSDGKQILSVCARPDR